MLFLFQILYLYICRAERDLKKSVGSTGCEVNRVLHVSEENIRDGQEASIDEAQQTWTQAAQNYQSTQNQRTVLIRGTKSQGDNSFSINSRGKQCTAMAAVAVAASAISDPTEWSPKFIDDLLEDGDNLYNYSLAHRPEVPDSEVGYADYLTTSMILTSNDVYVAIFKRGNKIWMFDSHSRNAFGIQCPNGKACLLGFLDVISLLKILMSNIPSRG